MIKPALKSPGRAGHDDVVDAYLSDRFNVGLEQVLLDATKGRVPPQLVGHVTADLKPDGDWLYSDGGLSEFFEGDFVVAGVTYRVRVETWSRPAAYVAPFLTNVAKFEPVEWTAAAALVHHG